MKIYGLSVNHGAEPLGVPPGELLFSFFADCEGEFLCEVCDGTGRVLASRTVPLSSAPGVDFPGFSARPARRYVFRVSSGGAFSELPFETAAEPDFIFISPDDDSLRSPEIVRRFTLSAEDCRGLRLAVTGLGLYRAYIGSRRVGDCYLTPGFNDYGGYLRYDTYDISGLVAPGENILSVRLGNGWYSGRFGIDKPPERGGGVFGTGYLCAYKIYRADTGRVLFSPDGSECARECGCLENSIYDGEVWDFTAERRSSPCHVVSPGYNTVPFFGAHIREVATLRATEIISPAGERILDFGQNTAGIVRFRAHLPRGRRVTVSHGEILQNGCFYRDNLRTARAQAIYISDGEERVYEPEFSYFGFRYIKLEGADEVPASAFSLAVLSSDIPRVSFIRTSSADINRLCENVSWGQRSNFLDIPTDCPQRDERLGWTADAQVFAATACYNSDTFRFYDKYLRDLRYDQTEYYSGDFPMYSPSLRGEAGAGGAVWADCGVILPDVLYRFYGDKAALRRHYPMMREYAELLLSRDRSEGGRGLITAHFTFGDWLAGDGVSPQAMAGGTDTGFISSVYYYNALSTVARCAAILSETDDAEGYSREAGRVRAAILSEYFTASGRLSADTQTAYAIALRYGVYRDREAAVSGLRSRLRRDLYKIKTGFCGTPHILPVLYEVGLSRDAFRMLFSEECPGWLYALRLGATTVWERWNSVLPDGKISGTAMNSLNHYAYGSVCEAIYGYVAGLRPLSPGWRRAVLEPHPDYRLLSAAFSYRSPLGVYSAEWKISGGVMSVSVTVPPCGSLLLRLPGVADEELPAGEHGRSVPAPADVLRPFSLDTPNIDILADPRARECMKTILPRAYGIVSGENPEFLSEDGHFILSLPMFGVSRYDGEKYGRALRDITFGM